MALVSDSEVKEILETDLANLQPFIDTANVIVQDIDVSDELKTEIEKWLAAHFASMRDQRVDSKSISDKSEDYEGETGMGYQATRYGQQAMQLDPTGTLAESGGGQKVKFKHTGT